MDKTRQKANERSKQNDDLPDSARDEQELKNEEATLDLPDVKDIPGQEHVRPPRLREYADTTVRSSDEEGENIWAGKPITEESSEVSDLEKQLLDESANDMPTRDDL